MTDMKTVVNQASNTIQAVTQHLSKKISAFSAPADYNPNEKMAFIEGREFERQLLVKALTDAKEKS